MPMNADSMSSQAKIVLLASLAHTLTICARDTYEAGTGRVLQPELLRAYNELLHRVTDATLGHILGSEGYSLKDILESVQAFGEKNRRAGQMQWAWEQAGKHPSSKT